jgi:hypothetical protein
MRWFFIPLIALALLVPGCLSSDNGPSTSDGSGQPSPMANATAPQPMHWSKMVVAGADPFNIASTVTPVPPCSQSVSACYKYDFTTNATTNLVATLAWGLQSSDFDLYLYQGDTQVSMDGINQLGAAELPATTQVMHVDALAPGTYTFWVVAWDAVGDSFTLDAVFG